VSGKEGKIVELYRNFCCAVTGLHGRAFVKNDDVNDLNLYFHDNDTSGEYHVKNGNNGTEESV
jgi:hypothetical protein